MVTGISGPIGTAAPVTADEKRSNKTQPAILRSRAGIIGAGLTDQVAAAGAMFLANVALARTQSKQEYGVFVLCYSIYTFVAGLHNAAILEPYVVYSSGKHSSRFTAYLKLMFRSNVAACLGVTALLLCAIGVLWFAAPGMISRPLIGLTIAAGVLLSAAFVRRTFYVQLRPHRAAGMSLLFLTLVCVGIAVTYVIGSLNGLTVFAIVAVAWIAAMLATGRSLLFAEGPNDFMDVEPSYWREHWKYARWVLATTFVFQLTTQGYYWLVAGFLSVHDVAELKAMYVIVTPLDQLFVALGYLVVPRLSYFFASRHPGLFYSLWKKYELLMCTVTFSVFIFVRIGGASAVHWLYAGKFDDASGLLYGLAAIPVVMGFGHAMNDALKSMERPDFIFLAYLASGLVTVCLGVPMVRRFGVHGAVTSMLASAAAYSLVLGGAFFSLRQRGWKAVTA